MSDLLSQFVTLPLLPVRIGVDLLQKTLEGLFPSGSGGPASTTNLARGRPALVPGASVDPAAAWEPVQSAGDSGSLNRPPRATGGSRDAHGRPATREERAMSCDCCGSDYCSGSSHVECTPVTSDKGLGGRCCVKVVQYTIVSAMSGPKGSDRIIIEPTTIAFSDDMDDSAFTAWVIAKHGREIDDKVPPGNRRYLRVAYQVFARFAEEEPNYCQEQVAALWDIARRLPPPAEERQEERQESGRRGKGGAGASA